jgi:RNA recognition motif-containing protein
MNTPNNTVYISNLSYKRDRKGVATLCSRYGEIKYIKIVVEPQTLQSRGMAFVEMATLDEAKKVIEGLNQQNIDGRTVKATYATPLKASSVSKFKHFEPKPEIKKEPRAIVKRAERKALKNPGNTFVYKYKLASV